MNKGVNRASVISKNQYDYYFQEFKIVPGIDTSMTKSVRGIGGKRKNIGSELIQIPFTGLGIMIDVTIHIMDEQVPSLLSLKYMLEKGLYISIQDKMVTLRGKTHDSVMKNYFLVQK